MNTQTKHLITNTAILTGLLFGGTAVAAGYTYLHARGYTPYLPLESSEHCLDPLIAKRDHTTPKVFEYGSIKSEPSVGEIRDYIFQQYGIEIIFPNYSYTNRNVPNTSWTQEEMTALLESIEKNPIKYNPIKSLYLYRHPIDSNIGIQNDNKVFLFGQYLPENDAVLLTIDPEYQFNQVLDDQKDFPFSNFREAFYFYTVHEFGHAFQIKYPHIYKAWCKKNEWNFNIINGWNSVNKGRVYDVREVPWEIFANQYSLFITKPTELSEDEFLFFEENLRNLPEIQK